MVRTKLISLSRIWYTIIVVLIHLILVYFGIKQCYFNDRLLWTKTYSSPKFELLIEKFCLLISILLLFIFIYPSLFYIGNYSNDNQQLTLNSLKQTNISLYKNLWKHSFSLSSTLHLIMSFLIIISTVLIHAKQIVFGLKDSGSLWRTDFDLLFDWSSSPISSISKRFVLSETNSSSLSFSLDSYSRLSLLNFLFASFICILREPNIFWSISKFFSIFYSFILALNVLQWCLMYGALQLLLKNICFNTMDSRHNIGYLLSNQPYTTFFLYLLLEFLIYISSIILSYYAYNRFKSKRSDDHCSNYCPSLIGIIILLLYTACKMPLVHDIFLLYIQTRIRILFITFIFEILHVLLILLIWIFLTTKLNWNNNNNNNSEEKCSLKIFNDSTTPNTPLQSTTISLPELNNDKPYEKIRIFQSEIYYHNRPKNWSLPLNQQSTIMAKFDNNDDIITRSPSYPNNNHEIQYRNAIRKSLSNLKTSQHPAKAVFLRSNTPPIPPVKKFTKEQVDAARLRAQQMIIQQQQQIKQRSPEYVQQRHSAALLISQV